METQLADPRRWHDRLRTGIAIIDSELTVVSVDARFTELAEVARSGLVGKRLPDVIPELAGVVLQVWNGGSLPTRPGSSSPDQRTYELTLPHQDGTRGTRSWFVECLELEADRARLLALAVQDRDDLDILLQTLYEREHLLHDIIEGTNDAIFVKNAAGHYVMMNTSDARGFGRPVHELLGRTDRELLPAPLADEVIRRDQEVISSRSPTVYEQTFLVPGSVSRTYLISKHPRFNEAGEVIGVVGTARDISERKQIELALRESERMLSTLMSNLPGMAYRCRNDPRWTMEFVSNGCRELTGYAPDDLIQNRRVAYGDLILPEDRNQVWEEVQKGISQSEPFRLSYRIATFDGTMKWVWEQGRAVFDPDGKLLALEGFITDITEQRRADAAVRDARDELESRVRQRTNDLTIANHRLEDEIQQRARAEQFLRDANERVRQNEAFLSSIIDHLPVALFCKDSRESWRITLWNQMSVEMFGLTKEEAIGRNVDELFPPDQARFFRKIDEEVLASGRLVDVPEETIDSKSLGRISLHTRKVPISGIDGQPRYLLGISENITERKRAEERLRRAQADAERANQSKSIFLANVSHEIRTPITAILGATELLPRTERGDPQWQHNVEIILRNGRHLLALIDDILDMSRIEAGRLEVKRQECSLSELLADVRAVTLPLCVNPSVALRFRFPDALPETIETDDTRFKQAVINLISNALKFTERGEVVVTVTASDANDPPLLQVEVTDSGPGIPQEDLERIFDVFTRGETANLRAAGGVGLGLTLSRWIARQLGGDLAALCNQGVGTTFQLTINPGPLTGVARIKIPTPESSTGFRTLLDDRNPLARLHGSVLLVEDFDDVRELFARVLRDAGAFVVTAVDGADAIQRGREATFDLILMDIRMPRVDGLTAARELRRLGCLAPMIALTASVSATDRQMILDAGFDDYWPKPCRLDQLLSGAADYLNTPDGPQGTDHAQRITEDFHPIPSGWVRRRLEVIQGEFVESLGARRRQLEQSWQVGDAAAVHHLVHQLAGTGGTFGFDELTALASLILGQTPRGTPLPPKDGMDRLLECMNDIEVRWRATRPSA